MFRGRFTSTSANIVIPSRTRIFFSTLLFGSRTSLLQHSAPLATCSHRCCATAATVTSSDVNNASSSVSQQSDQAEYDEILKSALSRQNQPGDENDDSKSSAKLLRFAMPNLFNELNIVREAAALNNNENKNNDETSSTVIDEK